MAPKRTPPEAEQEPEIQFTPAGALEQELAEAEQAPEAAAAPEAPEGAPQTKPKHPSARYRVLASGISSASGARYAGEELTAEELGDEPRIAKLLRNRAIEAIE